VGATEAARRLTKKYKLRTPINDSTARKIKQIYLKRDTKREKMRMMI